MTRTLRPYIRILAFWSLFVGGSLEMAGQNLYYVFFTDKPARNFDPYSWFDAHALERRQKEGLPLYDETDRPPDPAYVSTVGALSDSLRYALSWFNAVSIRAFPDQLAALSRLPFVKDIQPFSSAGMSCKDTITKITKEMRLDTLVKFQRKLMRLPAFEEAGITGKGVRIAIFDAGFKHADSHPALAHVREAGHILETRDFYGGKDQVFYHSNHGTEVMSCIAGMYKEGQIGCAKDAEFLLARTEHALFEKAVEEDHWVAAAEWADRKGADIINSSLGYTGKPYRYEDMDGHTLMVSLAAEMASQKGILVVNSQGNDGNNKWKYLGAPADAPSVLSVGGCMPMLPFRLKFSSYGPNADRVMKPNVTAPGLLLAAEKKTDFGMLAGTSFSSPLVAGFAACLMERYPEKDREGIFSMIGQSGNLFPYYDYVHGFGVPDALKCLSDSIPEVFPTFKVTLRADTVWLGLNPEVMMRDTANHRSGRVLYYHIENPEGYLDGYQYDILPNAARIFYFLIGENRKGILRIRFEGYLWEHELTGGR
jgi:hypothetical protein